METETANRDQKPDRQEESEEACLARQLKPIALGELGACLVDAGAVARDDGCVRPETRPYDGRVSEQPGGVRS